MEYIKLTHSKIEESKIRFFYSAPDKFHEYLKHHDLFIDYPIDVQLSSIPEGVRNIPFVGNMLIVSMLMGVGIEVDELDRVFFDCLKDVKKTFKKMFPYLQLCFDVKASTLTENNFAVSGEKSLFFTGGLDATSALIECLKDKPTLINIWGGDVCIEDSATHKVLDDYMMQLTQQIDSKYAFIKSNCREMYNERKISRKCMFLLKPWQNHGWWASFAHILSMTTLLAPIAYSRRIGLHYVGSSYDCNDKTFDANNDQMVRAIRFHSCRLESVDSSLDRTTKSKKLVSFCKENNIFFKLKVCWYRKSGENCSHCEKCYRTIMDIIVNHGDPNQYGFTFQKENWNDIKIFLDNTYVNKSFWIPIQKRFLEEKEYWMNHPEASWILNYNFNGLKSIKNKIIQVVNKFF